MIRYGLGVPEDYTYGSVKPVLEEPEKNFLTRWGGFGILPGMRSWRKNITTQRKLRGAYTGWATTRRMVARRERGRQKKDSLSLTDRSSHADRVRGLLAERRREVARVLKAKTRLTPDHPFVQEAATFLKYDLGFFAPPPENLTQYLADELGQPAELVTMILRVLGEDS